VLARKNGAHLLEYGHPFGYLPLREHLALMLAGLGICAPRGRERKRKETGKKVGGRKSRMAMQLSYACVPHGVG
jgi:hypothetical protein